MGSADVKTTRFPAHPRLIAAVALTAVALAASGCGRRGSLEPPNAPGKTSSTTPSPSRPLPATVGAGGEAPSDQAAVAAGDELSPSAVSPGGSGSPLETGRGARRGYTIPKQRFILDPLL